MENNNLINDVILTEGFNRMNFEKVTEMLSSSYWSPGIKLDEVKKGAAGSALVVGIFLQDQTQIGYSRVISDKTRFAYILDVYIDEPYRKKGLGQRMINFILTNKSLEDVYHWLLITKDAHDVYSKAGFKTISRPLDWMEIRNGRPER